jgi:hypothetical protein
MGKWYNPNGGWSFNSSINCLTNSNSNALIYADDSRDFFSNKTYLFRTKIRNIGTILPNSINKITPWNASLKIQGISNRINTIDGYINFYSSPSTRINANDIIPKNLAPNTIRYVSFTASNTFGNNHGIFETEVFEIDWKIFSYSWVNSDDANPSREAGKRSNGWSYYKDSVDDEDIFDYFVAHSSSINSISAAGPILINNNNINVAYDKINYLSKYIDFNFFNISFFYEIEGGGFKIYSSTEEPYVGTNFSEFEEYLENQCVLLYSFDTNNVPDDNFFYAFGVTGNRHLLIVADDVSGVNFYIKSLKIEGGYASENNRQYITTGDEFLSNIPDVSYSILVGQGDSISSNNGENEINRLFSKIGNGYFKAGIWENGVWNNGWRLDGGVEEFDDIDISIKINRDIRWRFRVVGPSSSVNNFEVGDLISIGNIIAIDINEQRRPIIDSYRIIGKDPTGINNRTGFIVVELDTTFPIRRIEKDSSKHRIKVTKNVWLSGVFLNGYFTGVWNFGLFKGYPLITEMFNTNWIDGIFDGGHFKSNYYISGTISQTKFSDGKVGLITEGSHGLIVGDTINIQITEDSENESYNGEHKIISVITDNEVVTDINYGVNPIGFTESGTFTTQVADALVQNMIFKSNNISRVTSVDSLETDFVFSYNSWMDVNFLTYSSVNIGKQQTKINKASRKSYSENNLYGYPTDDVLSSVSFFRDSYTLDVKKYNLGNKYKIYNNYIGNSSQFTEFFGSSGDDLQLFIDQGWTFSKYNIEGEMNDIVIDRTSDTGIEDIRGEELIVEAIGTKGGVLDISQPNILVRNRNNQEIEKNRYTFIEFDLITYSLLNIVSIDRICNVDVIITISNNGQCGIFLGDPDYLGLIDLLITTTIDGIVETEEVFGVDLLGLDVTIQRTYIYSTSFLISVTMSDTSPQPPEACQYTITIEQSETCVDNPVEEEVPPPSSPFIHFDNINVTTRNISEDPFAAVYLPIYENIEHINTPNRRKVEYFYNKRNLSMNFRGNGPGGGLTSSFIINNLNFYEVDMIPFFQYFIDININNSVQIPLQGIAPYIDYENNDFVFIDNIKIGLDSVKIESTTDIFSGIGDIIGSSNVVEAPSLTPSFVFERSGP